MFSRWLWTQITIAVVKRTNRIQRHQPPVAGDRVEPMPIEARYPGLAGCPLRMSRITPASEDPGWLQHRVLKLVLGLKEWAPLSRYDDAYDGSGAPYPTAYHQIAPTPVLPEDFRPGGDALAGVALRGPFSILTTRAGEGFEIDLSHIEALQPNAPFLKVGGRAHFEPVGSTGLRTTRVELDGRRVAPDEPHFPLLATRFLSGLSAHQTYIEHLIRCHMIVCNAFAMATVDCLPVDHPLRELFQPFIIETLRVNNDNIDGLILTDHSNVPSYTGFPLKTLQAVLVSVASGFDLAVMDPEARARRQGTLDDPRFVTLASRLALWRAVRDLASAYVAECLPEVDPAARAWCRALEIDIPNGVRAAVGLEDWESLSKDHVAHLAAICMFTASVHHHVVADMPRNYMMSAHLMAPAVGPDGLPRLGMVLEKMNSIAIAGVLRYRLMDRDVPFGRPERAAAWQVFQDALEVIQREVDGDPVNRPYRIVPRDIPSSIHA